MLSHYAWPGGLAFVIETPRRRFAAVLGPSGWRLGDARDVWRAGPPASATMATLELPPWLERQLPSLAFTQLALHTDFVRLNRVLARMQSEHANGAVVVLGPQPAAFVLTGGTPAVIYPTGRDGEHADMVAARAVGWVCVMAGPVAVDAAEEETQVEEEPPAPPVAEAPHFAAPEPLAPEPIVPEPGTPLRVATAPVATDPPEREPTAMAADPGAVSEPVSEPVTPIPARSKPAAADPTTIAGFHAGDRFVAATGARALSPEAAGQVAAVAGAQGQQIIELLDGSRTIQEIADTVAVAPEQVGQVVRILVGAKLAFRYVSRVRPATGARSSG